MIGATVSHYRILEKLGAGGMGVVYLAEDTKLKRTVALKFLPPSFSNDDEAKERFLKEARAASALQNNSICTIHEINETEDGQLFICMDCYEGGTLNEKIADGPLPLEDSINIIISIAEGLSAAHEKKIVHRDIKPANIFVTTRNEIKILDFGLAKTSGQTKLTLDGSTCGTIAYMSPEQTTGSRVDHRSDIWSLGVLFYELVVGELPFKGEYDQAVIYSIMNEVPEHLDESDTKIEPELKKVLQKALTKDVDKRYQSVDHFLLDLRDLKTMHSGLISPAIPVKRFILRKIRSMSRSKLAWLTIFIVLIAIATFIINPFGGGGAISDEVPSVAVTYLKNLGDEKDEFLTYGLTEDIIIYLSKAGLVRVPSMNDILKYRGSDLPLANIADSLGVKYILTGSFFREEDKFNLRVQLKEPAIGTTTWSGSWEEPFDLITKAKTNLIVDVVNAMGMTPNEAAYKEIGRRPTLSAEAYEFFLQGEYYFKQRKSAADIEIGIGFLKKAIEKDSSFVLAMVQLAQMYREKVDYDWAFEIYDKALVIAKEDDNLSALASIYNGIGGLHWRTGKLNEALPYMKDALNIFVTTGNLADEAMTLGNLGIISYSLGEVMMAINYLERALEIDVKLGDKYGQGIRLSNIGYMYVEVKEYEKAINYLMRSVKFFNEIDSQHGLSLAYDNIGKAYFYLNEFDLAIEYYSKAIGIFENIEMDVDLVISLSYIAICYAEINNDYEALNAIKLFKDKTRFLQEEAIPLATHWNLYKSYKLLNKDEPADTCLDKAYSMLMDRADKMESAEQREQFLNEIQDHKDIILAWEQSSAN